MSTRAMLDRAQQFIFATKLKPKGSEIKKQGGEEPFIPLMFAY